MRKSKWDGKREEVSALLESGCTITEVCERTGIPVGSTTFLLERWGLLDLQVRRTGKFSDQARKSWSSAYKDIHRAGRISGKNHWTYGKLKFRGEFIPEDEVKTILAEFREQDLTLAQMAEECGVSPKTITNQLRRFGLQGGLRSGSRTPQWKGGHSKYRGPGWLTIRQEILERDGHKCTVCGMTQEEAREGGHGLSVHHIVPFEQTQDNSDGNLTTLCQSCHMVAEWELGNHSTAADGIGH